MPVIFFADRTISTTDPWENNAQIAHFCVRIGPDGYHFTSDLMAKRKWERPNTPNVQSSVTTHFKEPMPQVNIAVTDATCVHTQQNLSARRLRIWTFYESEWFAVGTELVALHRNSPTI
tara:strand:+ start:162 stop:518 length:357 start_codon:yes stop_codon:yes gene_type:complete